MGIKYTCEHCGQPLKLPDSCVGEKELCPVCQISFLVPDPSVDSSVENFSAEPSDYFMREVGHGSEGSQELKWCCPWCEQGLSSGLEDAGQLVLCTFCSEEIRLPGYEQFAARSRSVPVETTVVPKTQKLQRVPPSSNPTSDGAKNGAPCAVEPRMRARPNFPLTEIKTKIDTGVQTVKTAASRLVGQIRTQGRRFYQANPPVAVGVVATVMILAVWGYGHFRMNPLWRQYVAHPHGHLNIPNCSFAGYRFGDQELPLPDVVADVRDFGAKGDGLVDDTEAFKTAIRHAGEQGGGAVYVSPGRYRLSEVLYLEHDGVVLRGAGEDDTLLEWTKSLEDLQGAKTEWSFRGGLIWARPPEQEDAFSFSPLPSVWVAAEAPQGSTVIEVDPEKASRYADAAGETVWMRWKGGKSLIEHMYGRELEDDSPLVKDWMQLSEGLLYWEWPNEIVAVEGNRVTLKKPLRLDIRSDWEVMMGPPFQGRVMGVGVENLTLQAPEHPRRPHLQDAGYNGIFFERVLHSWVRNVRLVNMDNALVTERASHNTFRGLHFTGMPCHHAGSYRLYSHDNLMEQFLVENEPFHGIGSQSMASGNVWRQGIMKHGTFDYHRGMPFDSIRTDITIWSDGRIGGPNTGGPITGRRIVHWNIDVRQNRKGFRSASTVYLPYLLSNGALVGVHGSGVDERVAEQRMQKLWRRNPDAVDFRDIDNGTVVSAKGKRVWPHDLYAAQRSLRKQQ